MNIALKEWAVVVEAMAEGRQIFLLRKGGIAEAKRGFEPKHRKFLFFPTWEHQHLESVRPEFHPLFDQIRPPERERLEIRFMAQVSDVLKAPATRAGMERLESLHIWTNAYIRQRYEYRPDLPLFIVVVRVFRLAEPQLVPADRRYAGCRSWVDLYRDVPLQSVEPVMPSESFERGREALFAELGSVRPMGAERIP